MYFIRSIIEFPVFLSPGILLFGEQGIISGTAARTGPDPLVCSCGRAMSGIVKVIMSILFFFFEKAKRLPSNAIEAGFRWTKKLRHKGVSELEKVLLSF